MFQAKVTESLGEIPWPLHQEEAANAAPTGVWLHSVRLPPAPALLQPQAGGDASWGGTHTHTEHPARGFYPHSWQGPGHVVRSIAQNSKLWV